MFYMILPVVTVVVCVSSLCFWF